ncbi:MAG: peptidase M23 [Cytophagales bacterium CG18_big_fil_WC_8_21_14_2_50_42_9]|nr:MAG: peptidase M23 [Cytophagales bacterium CG18_big_fil_WC_8_21_14_2_50_42_9]
MIVLNKMNKPILLRLNINLLVLAIVISFTNCVGKQAIHTIFQKRTPYETYENSLRQAKLHQTQLGQAWLTTGQKALQDSLLVTLPFQETGYFKADKPMAASYSFRARLGEVIDVQVTTRTKQDIKLFLDLFEINNLHPREAKHVMAADTTALNLSYKVEDNLVYLVRLQPELLRSGSYAITISSRPSLSFPVQGKDSRAIQSFWGMERDGGARQHEGVDIFAKKGTPVIAASAGTVTRVNETPRGGKVVWVSDLGSRHSLYYAHLDSQLVQPGQQVQIGDTLGLVGNTGNARTTPSHLHFGIYGFGRGAVDPYPFLYENNKKPAPLRVNENQIGQWGRIAKNKVTVRLSPSSKGGKLGTLARNTPVQVFGGTDDWFRVVLPDGAQGFLQENNLEGITKAVRKQTLAADTEIMEQPQPEAAPIALAKKDSEVSVLGIYQTYQLVRLTDGTLGWLMNI